MKWDGTSSDETKKQPYSIIERFMLKYPDPDSKLLDKELREGYKEAREAIIEAMESIDRERAQRIKEGRTESTRSTENVKYATGDDYTFNKQVDDAVSGKMARGYSVFVGKTPNLLEKAGLEQRPMLINQAHLRDIVHEKTNDNAHYHGIDINIIKQLPQLLKNPVAIYDSISNDNRNNSICVVTNKFDGDGNPIIVSIRSSENNVKYYDVSFNTVKSEKSNYATSVYGKDNFRYHLEAILDNDSFIFVSKSGAEKLLNKIIPRLNSDIKLQLLERLDNLGYNTIIHKSNNVVNTHSMQNGEKYAVSDDSGAEKITVKDVRAVQSVGRKSVNDFTSEDIKKTGGFAKRYFKEMGAKSPFFRAWFGDWRANDTSKITVADRKGAARGKIKNRDTGWDIQVSGKVFNESKHFADKNQRALPYLDYINSIVENAVLLDSYAIPENKAKSLNSVMMHSLYAIADMGKGKELVKLYIEELNDVNSDGTVKRAYQLQNIENQQSGVQGSGKNLSPITQTADVNTVSQLFNLVKQKDKNFNPKASSKIVNEDGTPKVVYHGTSEKFTVFDRTKGRSNMDIQGMFFSPWEIDARGYGGNVGEYYLSIKDPAPEGIAYKALKMFAGQNYAGIKAREYLEKLGYDGVNNSDEEIIAFYPNQIKSATDNIGTFDKGNNDIRYAVSDEETGGKRSRTRGAA